MNVPKIRGQRKLCILKTEWMRKRKSSLKGRKVMGFVRGGIIMRGGCLLFCHVVVDWENESW